MIPLDKISNFPNHPFKVENNAELQEMIESIANGGVKQPVIIRQKEDGDYEMISGHRRKLASQIAGLTEIPAIVREFASKGIKVAIKATVLSVKAIIVGIKALISALIAGGWIVAIIVIVICLIAMLCSSIFGIFFQAKI